MRNGVLIPRLERTGPPYSLPSTVEPASRRDLPGLGANHWAYYRVALTVWLPDEVDATFPRPAAFRSEGVETWRGSGRRRQARLAQDRLP